MAGENIHIPLHTVHSGQYNGGMNNRELEKMFKAFANRRRVAILRLLIKRKRLTVGNIAEGIRLSYKSTSKHLGVLYAAGVLDREQRGLEMCYEIAADAPDTARSLLLVLK